MMLPSDPIAAVTHPNPYPYYTALVAGKPFYRDAALDLWVAASAEAVTSVLTSELCRVRPVAEPVPRSLVGSPAGEVFGRLVRMNDGPAHAGLKLAVTLGLASIAEEQAIRSSERWARSLAAELQPEADPGRLTDFAFRLPAYAMASLLGFPPAELPGMAELVGDFVRGLSSTSLPEQVGRSRQAAGILLDRMRSLVAGPARSTPGVFSSFAAEAGRRGCGDLDTVAANAIGFLSQAYEATAGLMGNALLALARDAELRRSVVSEPGLLPLVIEEVLRFDPPVQNTRRFVAEDGVLAGQEVRKGEVILVLLAAANRDPAMNPEPDRFVLDRSARQILSFGAGLHVCPGRMLATRIAVSGVGALLACGAIPSGLDGPISYLPSINARIPCWGRGSASGKMAQ